MSRDLARCPNCGWVAAHSKNCAGTTRRLELEAAVWRLREVRGPAGVRLADVDAVCSALLHAVGVLEQAQDALASASEVLDKYADAEYFDGRPHGNREMSAKVQCDEAFALIDSALELPAETERCREAQEQAQ